MSKKEMQILLDKIFKGIVLSHERLVKQRAEENGELVFSDENGKVIRVKAKDLLK
jgi:hypothetical protein